jgi:hypothetical protein
MEVKKIVSLLKELGIKIDDAETYKIVATAVNIQETDGSAFDSSVPKDAVKKFINININLAKDEGPQKV